LECVTGGFHIGRSSASSDVALEGVCLTFATLDLTRGSLAIETVTLAFNPGTQVEDIV